MHDSGRKSGGGAFLRKDHNWRPRWFTQSHPKRLRSGLFSHYILQSVPVKTNSVQVVHYGMNAKVGNVSFDMPQPGEMVMEKPYSEETAQMIDSEVRSLISTAHKHTIELLTKHKENVAKVSRDIYFWNFPLIWIIWLFCWKLQVSQKLCILFFLFSF